jgi:RNA polymerase sigma-70 factor (ECF subfamily)
VRDAAAEVDTKGLQTGEIPVFTTAYQYDPEGQFFAAIVDGGILAAIERLPDDFRDTVILSDLEGLAYAEIAELLDIPVGTVKSRLFRGRRLLQQVLYEYATDTGYVHTNPQ